MAYAKEEALRRYYRTLFELWGHQHWWPARTRFEVIAGAYLTQNTSWTNVEMALRRLRSARVLNVAGIRNIPLDKLEETIRCSGYFRQKARSLKAFVTFLDEVYGGSLIRMFRQPTDKLREELLSLKGVGPETADSILLYGGQRAVFVVDAYTRRIVERHEILPAKAPYENIRALMERTFLPLANELDAASQIYNEMHAMIVGIGKKYCTRTQPKCQQCPLRVHLPDKSPLRSKAC